MVTEFEVREAEILQVRAGFPPGMNNLPKDWRCVAELLIVVSIVSAASQFCYQQRRKFLTVQRVDNCPCFLQPRIKTPHSWHNSCFAGFHRRDWETVDPIRRLR